MEAPGMKFVALRDIPAPGDTAAYAYRAGELVHEDAVEGDEAWLTVGTDVAARPGFELVRPAKNAGQAAWAAYVVSLGKISEDEAADMSRSDLILLAEPKKS